MNLLRRQIWALLLLVVAFLPACSSKHTALNDKAVLTDSASRPDSEVSGARITLYDRGQITAKIVADTILKFESLDSTMAYGLDIDIFDSTEVVTTNIVGDSGIIRESTGNISIYGNVVAVTQDSIKLETDSLFWDSKIDSIKTKAFVRLTKGQDVIRGWGLQADQRLHSAKILRQVSGTITEDKKAPDL